MNTDAIKEIMAAFEASTLAKMELEADDMKIRMEKAVGETVVVPTIEVPTPQAAALAKEAEAPTKASGTWVTAPIVGTFYQARSAGSTPFIEIGQKVKKGDVLCIIEAMKVMNEIHAPVDGVIAEILVTNESMVEYGQELIRIGEAA